MPRPDGGAPCAIAQLETQHLDALRELANLGAGHAATALSLMVGRRVHIGVPAVSLTPADTLNSIRWTGTHSPLLIRMWIGDPFMSLTVAFDEHAAGQVVGMLLSRSKEHPGWRDPLGISVLSEVANILGGAYVSALARVTRHGISLSVPTVLEPEPDQTVSCLLGADVSDGDLVFCLETNFSVGDQDSVVRGTVLLVPRVAAMPGLLNTIGAATMS